MSKTEEVDIVTRLRQYDWELPRSTSKLRREAADEIERLRRPKDAAEVLSSTVEKWCAVQGIVDANAIWRLKQSLCRTLDAIPSPTPVQEGGRDKKIENAWRRIRDLMPAFFPYAAASSDPDPLRRQFQECWEIVTPPGGTNGR